MKKIFTLLIAAVSAFVLALIPTAKASAAEVSEGFRTFPNEAEMAAESFELNGVKYTKDQSGYDAIYVDEPQSVETLVLLDKIGDQRVIYYDGPLFEAYTNVKDVIVLNHYFDDTIDALKSIPQSFDLYVGGNLGFNYGFEDIKVDDLYICNPYAVSTQMMFSSYRLEHTEGTPMKSINYVDYVPAFEEVVSAYNSGETKIVNADGETLDLIKVAEQDLKYPMEVFYPYENFSYTPPFLGCEGYAYFKDYTAITDPKNQMSYIITGVDEKLDTLYYDWHYENDGFKALPETLVLASYSGESISYADGTNVIAFNNTGTFAIVDFRYFESIRLYPADENGGMVIDDYTSHQGFASGMTVYLPSEYADTHFADVKADTNIKSVELYSLSDYEKPMYSKFISDDSNVYQVADQTLMIADLETQIAECTSKGAVFTTETPVDLQIALFNETGSTGGSNTTNPDTENPTEPDVEDNLVFEDETEFIEGYKTTGGILYSGDYELEDILHAVAKYMLWQDGSMIDIEGYNVSFKITVDNRLNTTIKKDGEIIADVNAPIKKIDSTVGNFIYLGLYQGRGALILDSSNPSEVSAEKIAEYALRHDTSVESIGKMELKEDKVEGYFKHPYAENLFVIDMEVKTLDLSKIDHEENVEVKYEQVICPDDEYDDPESEYNVKTIKEIYIPKNMNAIYIPSIVSEAIVTFGEELYGEYLEFGSAHDYIDNQSDYSFAMIGMLPNDIKYKHEVPVKLLSTTEKVAYVVLEDDTVIAVLVHGVLENEETLVKHAEAFLSNTLNVSTPKVTLSEEVNLNTTDTFFGSTYKEDKELVVVSSGVAALTFSTPANPVDDSKLFEGYHLMTNIIFTDNYTPEQAVQLLGKHILLFSGSRVDSGYTLDAVISKKSITFTVYTNDFMVARITTNYRVVSDSEVGPFVYAGLGRKSVIVVEQNKDTETNINDLYEYVLTTYGGAKEVKVINTELEYATLGSDRAYEVYEHINGNYYNFDTEIIVTTFEEEAKPTEADKHVVITTEKPSVMDEIKDTVNEWVDGFKDKFENNDAFKTVSILLGTILGVFLVLGIIKIFKKIFRWLGR